MARYNFKESEKKWQEFWIKNKIFAFNKDELNNDKEVYSIDTPPPTVSGKMHIGHAYGYSQEDYIGRYKRMRGFNVFQPFGTDDNGLATMRLVEKKKKISERKLSRKEYADACYNYVLETKEDFVSDWKNLGMACDFSTPYSTIDSKSQKVSQELFLDLQEKGHVYQEEAPMSWCVKCQTAVAQAEFESVDLNSQFHDIAFFHGEEELIISTTRPELIPACVALFAHPDDDRYKNLKGKFAKVPLLDYEVPIMFDATVEKDKGTGLMMVCTFGDKEDIDKWQRYNLSLRAIFTEYGVLNETAAPYNDLKILDARKKILEDLKEKNYLKGSRDITHAVNVHERCGTEIEFLKTKQWFIRILDKKQSLLDQVDKLNWHPSHMKVRMTHWIENLNWDWCISRQRYFGVPFPLWHCKSCGKIVFASKEQLPVDPFNDKPLKGCDCGNSELVPEQDVMDTWATSSVSPQISLGEYDLDYKKMMPMSLRPQGHDIIRTWAFYTLTRAYLSHNTLPWKDILVHGFVTDPKGKKMSKSKGNVVDPRLVVDKFGADALRYWGSGVRVGDDIPFMEKDLTTGLKTVTKLYNAIGFAKMHLPDSQTYGFYDGELDIFDKWMLSKYYRMLEQATIGFDNYEVNKAKFAVDKFFWQNLCDFYIELIKDRLYNPENYPNVRGTKETLFKVNLGVLKLFAPIMPHITEELYKDSVFEKKEEKLSIHLTSWPKLEEATIDVEAETIGDEACKVVEAVRKFKSENKLSLKEELSKVTVTTKVALDKVSQDLKGVAKAKELVIVEGEFAVEIEK